MRSHAAVQPSIDFICEVGRHAGYSVIRITKVDGWDGIIDFRELPGLACDRCVVLCMMMLVISNVPWTPGLLTWGRAVCFLLLPASCLRSNSVWEFKRNG